MKRVVRDPSEKCVSGLCGGIARALDVDPVIVRLVVVFLTLFSAVIPGVLTYLCGWWLVPLTPEDPSAGDSEVEK